MKDITSIVRVGDQFKLKFARQGFSIGETVDVIKLLPFDEIVIKSNQCSRTMEIDISELKEN
jgi:hypothetical protein|tara:strand:- start:528 stop:713 length:186 start_codon:yes stop_codon:yes gene_type:complete